MVDRTVDFAPTEEGKMLSRDHNRVITYVIQKWCMRGLIQWSVFPFNLHFPKHIHCDKVLAGEVVNGV